MKRQIISFSFFVIMLGYGPLNAQDAAYKFQDMIDIPVTSVKDQYRSGTCWSFASTALSKQNY